MSAGYQSRTRSASAWPIPHTSLSSGAPSAVGGETSFRPRRHGTESGRDPHGETDPDRREAASRGGTAAAHAERLLLVARDHGRTAPRGDDPCRYVCAFGGTLSPGGAPRAVDLGALDGSPTCDRRADLRDSGRLPPVILLPRYVCSAGSSRNAERCRWSLRRPHPLGAPTGVSRVNRRSVQSTPLTLRPPVSQVAVKLTALKMRLPLDADAWTSIPWLTPESRNSAGTVRVVWSGDKVTSRTRSSSGVVTMTS
jgi:hypothetical protein